jgi:hypothetical protein
MKEHHLHKTISAALLFCAIRLAIRGDFPASLFFAGASLIAYISGDFAKRGI